MVLGSPLFESIEVLLVGRPPNSGNTTGTVIVEEEFSDRNLYLELVDIYTSGLAISPGFLYNLLSLGHTEIDDIISKLGKEEIIVQNPTRHWDKN